MAQDPTLDSIDDGLQDMVIGGLRVRLPRPGPMSAGGAGAPPPDAPAMGQPSNGGRAPGTNMDASPSAPAVPTQPDPMPSLNKIMATSNISRVPTPPLGNNAQADVDKYSRPINPRGPDGNILPQYKMGTGRKVLGGIAAGLEGFAGQRYTGPYIGPGATNARFDQDESLRQQNLAGAEQRFKTNEQMSDENRKLYDSGIKQAYDTAIAGSREDTAAARQATATAQQTAADARQQLADEKDRDITYDQQTKRFMKGGKVYVPKTIEEGASLEAANGITNGPNTILWKSERKNQPINVNNGRDEAKTVTVGDKVMQFNPKTNRYDIEVGPAKKTGTATFKDKASVDKYSNDWYHRERAAVEAKKARFLSENKDADDKELQAGYQGIESDYQNRANQFEEEKKGYYSQVGGGQQSSQGPAAAAKTYKFKTKTTSQGDQLGSDDGKNWVYISGKKNGQAYKSSEN